MFKKNKELISYIIVGGFTTLVNWVSYSLSLMFITEDINVANISAWIISVVFAFFANKYFVFEQAHKVSILKEFLLFFGTRIFSGILEIGLLPFLIWIGINQILFGVEGFIAKVITTIVVLIINYIGSKYLAFKGGKKDE